MKLHNDFITASSKEVTREDRRGGMGWWVSLPDNPPETVSPDHDPRADPDLQMQSHSLESDPPVATTPSTPPLLPRLS